MPRNVAELCAFDPLPSAYKDIFDRCNCWLAPKKKELQFDKRERERGSERAVEIKSGMTFGCSTSFWGPSTSHTW